MLCMYVYNVTYENTLFYFVFRTRSRRYVYYIILLLIDENQFSLTPSVGFIAKYWLAKGESQENFAANDLLCV